MVQLIKHQMQIPFIKQTSNFLQEKKEIVAALVYSLSLLNQEGYLKWINSICFSYKSNFEKSRID